MEIIYLISVAILLISFILVNKTERILNIISFICISIVTFFCYNTFVCYILTFFTIPIKLWLLSIINILISLLFIVPIVKNKQIQRYNFNSMEILCIFLIGLVVLAVSYINFGFPLDVNYETGDSATHFLASTMFADSDYMLGAKREYDEVYGNLSTMKPTSYVNTGILIKSICTNSSPIERYNIFVGFEIFVLFLIGVSIYSAMENFAKTKEHTFISLIISLICILGYPLNSLLFGFEYLTMGILIICAIIDLINYYDEELLRLRWFVPIMALLNLGLFLAYYMFVPFVYSSLWIYFCIKNYNKNKKIINKELIILLGITLLIPFVLGYIYTLAPKLYSIFIDKSLEMSNIMENSSYIINSGFANNGYIYVNLYSNMLLLLPLTVYLFVKVLKKQEYKNDLFIILLVLFTIGYIAILCIGNKFGKVSMYYLCKNYFPLWIVLLYCNYKALLLMYERGKYLPRLFVGSYVFLMIICTIFSNVEVEYVVKNNNENVLTVMDIFGANKTILLKKPKEFTQEELEILEYARKKLDYNSKIEVVTDENAYYWQYVLLQYVNKEDIFKDKCGGQEELIYKFKILENKINKVDYMIYFNRSKKYNELKDKIFENSEIIYENSSGGILKYKNQGV